MRIDCPFCGMRDAQEFSYLGDAKPQRPNGMDATEAEMFDYVYLRDNPRGEHEELWFHGAGCRSWVVVRRNTYTHAISDVRAARTRGEAGA